MGKIEAVVWDMDGVIIEEGLHSPVNDRIFSRFGIRDTVEKRAGRFTGMRSIDMFRKAVEDFGLDADPEELTREKVGLLKERAETSAVPVEGVFDLMAFLGGRGVAMAVASSTEKEVVSFILGKMEVLGFLKACLGGDEVERGKPAPDIFLRAAERLGKEPRSCVVVEDSRSGIAAAKAAGMTVIGFGENGHLADYPAGSMAEVKSILSLILELG